jgi:hypothetical protein
LSQVTTSGADVTFAIIAVGTGTLEYQWKHGTIPIAGATGPTLTLTNVQLDDAGLYSVRVFRSGQGVESVPAILTVDGVSVQDLEAPTLSVTSPTFVRVTDSQFIFKGSAKDDIGVGNIGYQCGDGPWSSVLLENGNSWNFDVQLHPGTNEFLLKAVDLLGNNSATQKVVVFQSVTTALNLTISGEGLVTGATNDQGLEIGRTYSLVATPKPTNYFANWVVNGTVVSSSTLTFFMWSNTTVQANFTPNPYPQLKGTYAGLFYDTTVPTHETSGFLTLKLRDTGKFSGKVTLAGVSYSLRGQFGFDLHTRQTIVRPSPNSPLVIDLQLAIGSERITGSINNGDRTVSLEGYRAVFHATANPATNYVGKYTVAFGMANSAADPCGHGYGVVAVNAAGGATFKGAFAEGSAVSAKVPLASNGQWAFYARLYKGRGSVFGWLRLSETDTNDVHGLLLWTKPSAVIGAYYGGGFTNELTPVGSRFVVPSLGTPIVNLSNAVVLLEGGNLAGLVLENVVLDPLNKVTVVSANTNSLTMKLSPSSGRMSGSFIHPQTLRTSSIKGVVLQKQNAATGFFLGTNESGSVSFGLPEDFPLFDATR